MTVSSAANVWFVRDDSPENAQAYLEAATRDWEKGEITFEEYRAAKETLAGWCIRTNQSLKDVHTGKTWEWLL